MIDFALKDDNIKIIKSDSKLGNLICKNKYRIYGLRQGDNNPPVMVEIPKDGRNNNINITNIVSFFKKNGIEMEGYFFNPDAGDNVIYIGLRRDIRDFIEICSATLQTLIYCIEGKMILDLNFVQPGIPKFEINKITVKKKKSAARKKYAVT